MYSLDPTIVRPGCPLREELVHRQATGAFGEDPDSYIEEFMLRLADGKVFSRSFHTADGRIVQTTHQPIADGGWVSTHQDVTESQGAEMALRKNEHVLQSTFDHMIEGIGIFDADFNLVAANRRYRELLGIPAELCEPRTPWRTSCATAPSAAITDHAMSRKWCAPGWRSPATPGTNSSKASCLTAPSWK